MLKERMINDYTGDLFNKLPSNALTIHHPEKKNQNSVFLAITTNPSNDKLKYEQIIRTLHYLNERVFSVFQCCPC